MIMMLVLVVLVVVVVVLLLLLLLLLLLMMMMMMMMIFRTVQNKATFTLIHVCIFTDKNIIVINSCHSKVSLIAVLNQDNNYLFVAFLRDDRLKTLLVLHDSMFPGLAHFVYFFLIIELLVTCTVV